MKTKCEVTYPVTDADPAGRVLMDRIEAKARELLAGRYLGTVGELQVWDDGEFVEISFMLDGAVNLIQAVEQTLSFGLALFESAGLGRPEASAVWVRDVAMGGGK
jgi:hypothetical protein